MKILLATRRSPRGERGISGRSAEKAGRNSRKNPPVTLADCHIGQCVTVAGITFSHHAKIPTPATACAPLKKSCRLASTCAGCPCRPSATNPGHIKSKAAQSAAKSTVQDPPRSSTPAPGNDRLRLRLLDMGFVRGTRVTVIGTAPGGDPMLVRLYGYDLSLRRSAADRVVLSREDP